MATVNNGLQLAQANPEAMLKINSDKVLEYSQELGGAPLDILFTDKEVEVKKAAIAKQRQQAEQVQAAEMGSKAIKNAAQAQAAVTGGGA
jgi:hypothetical protein